MDSLVKISPDLNSNPVRLRFAPSPTGYLHIGGVRTALFNWLYARQKKGQFLLRIEDTDLERSETKYTEDILNSLKWLGLNWDEEPLYQSKRLEIYRQYANILLEKGDAYRCTCSEVELEDMRKKSITEGRKPQYDRRCRNQHQLPVNQPYVVRAKIPLQGVIEFNDLSRGLIRVANSEIDDFVLIRTNGTPTYNLSVVIDDMESKITHVLRGDDHINNTPKQIHLYQSLGYPVPIFTHLPMILGPDKKKLSKRHGAVSAHVYRSEGYLPETLLNFLARLGWSHGDQEVFSVPELIEYFSIEKIQKSSAVFNLEKLLWLNGVHIREASPDRLLQIITEDYSHHFTHLALKRVTTQLGCELIKLIQPKVKLLTELTQQLVPLCTPGIIQIHPGELNWSQSPNLKISIKDAVKEALEHFETKIKEAPFYERKGNEENWGNSPSLSIVGIKSTDIEAIFRQMSKKREIKLGDLSQPIRLIVTGKKMSAGLFDLMAILPWDLLSQRLQFLQTL